MATSSPIGITFLPSEENAQMGPKRGNLEGDLGEAFKILSLRLPRVQGSRTISPHVQSGPGMAQGMPGGFNPQAAIFEAILKSMTGGGPLNRPGPVASAPMGPIGVGITPSNEDARLFDRRNPGQGNRGDGAPVNRGGPVAFAPFTPPSSTTPSPFGPPRRGWGPFNREG